NERNPITIWPNPANDIIRIAGNNFYTKAQIADLSGRIFSETKLQGNVSTINISKLPVGIYLVKIQTDNGAAYSQKIVKQ
ncbi:MAG TPA: T9SS type A sorting domain-containing protein, partial [Chitinophagaceae bacterium]|nr:T9SS type A sorting domain-containing protein [Chitinophagaceae bacterium]